nr:retrovirus-related Pol polyprotein from transposon 17.6 [Tanacetum cinerariifolium]
MERFKIETERMKGAPECMQIFGFMHRINNPKFTKRLNEHVPRIMEEMMIATTAFIRGEAAAANKKKGHMSWKPQDQSKKYTDKRPDFRAAEANKFQPPPPMVTPVEKRNGNKFCDFHNDKGNGTEGPLVIEAEVGGHTIHCIGETTWPLGQLKLLVAIGDATHSTKAWMNFMIVKLLSPYNGIIRRPGLKAIQAVPSTVHGMLKFPTEEGIVTICNSLLIPAECASVNTSSVTPRGKKAHPANLTVPLHPNFLDQEVVVGDRYPTKDALKHRLNVREGCPPVRQKKRGQATERTKAIQAEVEKLVEAGIMREVYYHDWLSNPVMVKKHDRSWRMCVDFTDINKACPQDCYPLPEIDWKSDFRWTTEAEQAFQQLKQHLSALPLLAAPKPQEELIMYLSATHGAISAVLLTERGTAQTPVYFISRALQGPELNYSPMEKLVLSLVFAAKRLRRYFQVHPIMVITDQPIKQVMSRPDAAGRLQKWSIMLGEHNITYRPRTSIKGKILADFLNEIPSNASQGVSVAETQEEPWPLFTDGSSCVDGSGAGLILTNPDGVEFTYTLRFQFAASNNEAEYEALIAGKEVTAVIEKEGPTWMTELVNYLKEGTLLEDEKEARKIRLKARQYELMEGILYKRSFLTPWLRCVGPLQAKYVMKEIHEGSCSMHAGPRSVVAKAIQLGYFWPTMYKDAQDMIRKCSDCQIHRPFPEGPGKVKFLIVAMDYFKKWIEAKAVATITGGQVKKFVWDNIVCRFSILGEIISDNDKQFADNPFKDWCDKLNITQHFASIKHPQSNGLVERANKSQG